MVFCWIQYASFLADSPRESTDSFAYSDWEIEVHLSYAILLFFILHKVVEGQPVCL
jgi:hypothetical protein